MWLINCRTLELEEKQDFSVPYSIFSHRWGTDEVTFQDMQHKQALNRESQGYKKIQQFCSISLARSLDYGWVDTCCIDKSSSAQLSEAINSMWGWYKNAVVCIASLSDFTSEVPQAHRKETAAAQEYLNLDHDEEASQDMSASVEPDIYDEDEHNRDGEYTHEHDDQHAEDNCSEHRSDGQYSNDDDSSTRSGPEGAGRLRRFRGADEKHEGSKEEVINVREASTTEDTDDPDKYVHDRRDRRRERRTRYTNEYHNEVRSYRSASETMRSIREEDALKKEALSKCSWFHRAWTLQELLSPRDVAFYDANWDPIGTKESLAPTLSAVTGIPVKVLYNQSDIQGFPIAERMAWASKRKATRPEDEAYSLLGLFDVNMPMLYGEGSKAFKRLQEEIIKQSNDHTIFLWDLAPDEPFVRDPDPEYYGDYSATATRLGHSMFAPSPSAFSSDWNVHKLNLIATPFSITNSGMNITLTLQPWVRGVFLGLLDCYVLPNVVESFGYRAPIFIDDPNSRDGYRQLPPGSRRPGIFLRRGKLKGTYQRIALDKDLYGFVDPGKELSFCQQTETIFIDLRKIERLTTFERLQGFHLGEIGLCPALDCLNASCMYDPILKVSQTTEWSSYPEPLATMPTGQAGTVAMLRLETCEHWPIKFIKLGFDFDLRPVCVLATENKVNHHDKGLDMFDCVTHQDWSDFNGNTYYEYQSDWYGPTPTHRPVYSQGNDDPSDFRAWRRYLKGPGDEAPVSTSIILPSVEKHIEHDRAVGSEKPSSVWEATIKLTRVEILVNESGQRKVGAKKDSYRSGYYEGTEEGPYLSYYNPDDWKTKGYTVEPSNVWNISITVQDPKLDKSKSKSKPKPAAVSY